jgi:two-component system, LuxR family, response regulator FixJ
LKTAAAKKQSDEALIYLVDDDAAVRDSLGLLLRSVGLECEVYSSALEFLESYDPERHSCLVADIRMPGLSGLELQQRLIEQRAAIPIVFITGHGDVPMAVEAMKAGAFDFLQKPFSPRNLLERIERALAADTEARQVLSRTEELRQRYTTLTPREKEVMALIVAGHANKVIAMDLGLSERTVEIHRARVMEKMATRSVAHLVRMALELESPGHHARTAGPDRPPAG